jgi:hypothetical protein
MTKCPVCKDLISPNAIALKASCGFVDTEGIFHDDVVIVFHKDCYHNYLFNPFEQIEINLIDN